MKIILLNGSPKKNHNDTIKITNAFVEGLKSNTQCEVKTINVNEKTLTFVKVVSHVKEMVELAFLMMICAIF